MRSGSPTKIFALVDYISVPNIKKIGETFFRRKCVRFFLFLTGLKFLFFFVKKRTNLQNLERVFIPLIVTDIGIIFSYKLTRLWQLLASAYSLEGLALMVENLLSILSRFFFGKNSNFSATFRHFWRNQRYVFSGI